MQGEFPAPCTFEHFELANASITRLIAGCVWFFTFHVVRPAFGRIEARIPSGLG
jgi:hypothetical protein